MSQAKLLLALQREQALQDAEDKAFMNRLPKRRRAELVEARKNIASEREALFKTPAFQRLVDAFSKQFEGEEEIGANRLLTLISTVAILPQFLGSNPQRTARLINSQNDKHVLAAQRLRDFATGLAPNYARRANALADDIEGDFMSCGYELLAGNGLLDTRLLARRGTTTGDGAWRGWLIKCLDQWLEMEVEYRYATIAALLTWAGVPKVTSQLVRSTLKRGHT